MVTKLSKTVITSKIRTEIVEDKELRVSLKWSIAAFKTFAKMKAILILFVLTFSITNSYKILGIFPFGSKSHYAIGEATLRALNEAGHEVTMISVFEPKKPIKNYRQIKIADVFDNQEKSELS